MAKNAVVGMVVLSKVTYTHKFRDGEAPMTVELVHVKGSEFDRLMTRYTSDNQGTDWYHRGKQVPCFVNVEGGGKDFDEFEQFYKEKAEGKS